jgi:hypothetical protein
MGQANGPLIQATLGGQALGGVVERQMGPAALVVKHFDVLPAHVADARAQRLADGLLDGETAGQAGGAPGALRLFARREETVGEARPVALQAAPHALDLDQVNAGGQHQCASTGPATAMTRSSALR